MQAIAQGKKGHKRVAWLIFVGGAFTKALIKAGRWMIFRSVWCGDLPYGWITIQAMPCGPISQAPAPAFGVDDTSLVLQGRSKQIT